jgi:hypothetical protein
MLQKNALDQQAWFIKVRATTLKGWVDDTQLEEQGEGAYRCTTRSRSILATTGARYPDLARA